MGVGLPVVNRVRRFKKASSAGAVHVYTRGQDLGGAERVLVFAQGDDRAGRSGRADACRVDRRGRHERDVRRGCRHSRGYPRGDVR